MYGKHITRLLRHYRDATWPSWRLNSRAVRLFVQQVQQFVQAKGKGNKAPYYWPFVKDSISDRWIPLTLRSQLMRKAFPCHDVIMTYATRTFYPTHQCLITMYCVIWYRMHLLALEDMVMVLKVSSPNTCYRLSSWALLMKLPSGDWHRTTLMISKTLVQVMARCRQATSH